MANKGATSRCQRACYQSLLNTLASYLFGSPPNVVHHRGCPLASLTVDVAIQDAPGRLSHKCTRQGRGKHRDHTQEAVVSQQWSAGSSSPHSLALSAACIYLVRGQKVANYHTVRATVPCREGLRPGAALLRLWYRQLGSGSERNMRLDMAVFAWGHMLHEQDASAQLVPSCNARKGE